MSDLQKPRHISTLPKTAVAAVRPARPQYLRKLTTLCTTQAGRGGQLGRQAVQHVAADRISAHVDFYLHLTDDSENDTHGGASEYRAHAGLLSFLVRPDEFQAGGYHDR